MKLKEFLDKKGFSKAKIARMLDITPSYFNIIVNGHKVPSRQLALKIEEFTEGKVKASELLGLK